MVISMPAGAPTKYKPEYAEMLIEHCAEGLGWEEFAGVIGVAEKTIYNWFNTIPEFLQAKEIGYSKARLWWGRVGRDNVVERNIPGEGTTKINTGAWIINMKNRFGWTDRQDVTQKVDSTNHNVNLNAELDLQRLDDDEIELLERLVDKMGNKSA